MPTFKKNNLYESCYKSHADDKSSNTIFVCLKDVVVSDDICRLPLIFIVYRNFVASENTGYVKNVLIPMEDVENNRLTFREL